MNPREIAIRFNDCINNRDLQGLAELMTDDHAMLIDMSSERTDGKDAVLHEWKLFFEQFPDYRNHFDTAEATGDLVRITGRSTCSHKPLDGPALWTAKVRGDRLTEWSIYDDTPENRTRLGIG